jgi:hypothetical protein
MSVEGQAVLLAIELIGSGFLFVFVVVVAFILFG